MIVTKEEAKKLWCPMYQVSGANGFNNRDDGNNVKCIADECMMWTWSKDAISSGTKDKPRDIHQGYCGLVNYHREP